MLPHVRILLPAAVVGLLAVTGCGQSEPTGSSVAAAPTSKASPTGTASERPAVPERLAFTGSTLDGAPFDAASLAGKPVVLWFWAPWCPRCRAAGPEVARIAGQYTGRVTVLGIAGLSDDTTSMRDFVSGTSTGALTHLGDAAGAIWKRFGVTTQNVYVLISADGAVVHTGELSNPELERRIGALAG